MWKIAKNVFFMLIAFCILDLQSIAEEKKNETELNVYTGMFDFVMISKDQAYLVCNIKTMYYSEKVF